MKKSNWKKYLYLTMVLSTMVLIFFFSSQPANESQALSDSLFYTLFGQFLMKVLPSLGYTDLRNTIRKYAHMCEFACLMVSFVLYLKESKNQKINIVNLLALFYSTLYAISDEFHQLFVEGRACQIKDVGIDIIGCLLGMIFINVVLKIIEGVKNVRK